MAYMDILFDPPAIPWEYSIDIWSIRLLTNQKYAKKSKFSDLKPHHDPKYVIYNNFSKNYTLTFKGQKIK